MFLFHPGGYSEPLLRNLFSVVLNRLTEPEIPMAWNDAKDHALMLITRNMHDFIHTSVVSDIIWKCVVVVGLYYVILFMSKQIKYFH